MKDHALLEEIRRGDQPGNKIAASAAVQDGRIIGVYYHCDRASCGCVGGWWEGLSDGEDVEILPTTPIRRPTGPVGLPPVK